MDMTNNLRKQNKIHPKGWFFFCLIGIISYIGMGCKYDEKRIGRPLSCGYKPAIGFRKKKSITKLYR